MNYSSNLAL